MRWIVFLVFSLLTFIPMVQAQENPHYELIHIHVEQDMTQHEFAMQYNICWEEVHRHFRHSPVFTIRAEIDLYFPPDVLPCYNADGQRLIYYEDGTPLVEPYYTDMRVYITQAHETFVSLTRAVNVCIEDITYQNEHYLQSMGAYAFVEGQELFIPDTRPCYDEEGRKLRYMENGDVIALEGRRFTFIPNDTSAANYLESISYYHNVCLEDILAANHVASVKDLRQPYGEFVAVVMPVHAPQCYNRYRKEEFTKTELSLLLNVCESAIYERYVYRVQQAGQFYTQYHVRHDALPCYDEHGILLATTQQEQELPPQASEANPSDPSIFQSGNSLEDISRHFNVCAADLLAANAVNKRGNFVYGDTITIPHTPPCYDEHGYKLNYPEDGSAPIAVDLPLYIVGYQDTALQNIAWDNDVCLSDLLAANPHLNLGDELYWSEPYFPPSTFSWEWEFRLPTLMIRFGSEVFIPPVDAPCYEVHTARTSDEKRDLAQSLNVCIEQLYSWQHDGYVTYWIPHDREPCYDDNGHRLIYFDAQGNPLYEPMRLDWDIYIVPYAMSTYELSRRLNVCINQLLKPNPILKVFLPYPNLEVVVPKTAPCYDETTGKQLVYKDELGNSVTEPYLAEYLTYQVNYGDAWGIIGQMFNVCPNRLIDFNQDFLPNVWTVNFWGVPEHIARVDGIFDAGVYVRIPTDRPPCYEYGEQTHWLRYVCYDIPLDMNQENPDAMINPDGNHCYNIEDPKTVIWHDGNRYLYQFRDELYTNDFMAWCFGVSEDDIIAEANNPIVYIFPYDELLIRNPTRPCYVREDDSAETVHWVQAGETLHDIAWRYGKLPSWIAEANHLSDENLIWAYQRLVIPEGINLWHVLYIFPAIGAVGFVGAIIGFLFKRRQGLTGTKKKRKPVSSTE